MSSKKFFAAVLLVCTTTLSFAEPVQNHFYLDGVYMFNVSARADITDFDFNESNGLAMFGGYRFNSLLSVEAGGIAFEPIKSLEVTPYSNIHTEYEVTGYAIGGKLTTSIGKLFTAWAGAGLFSWKSTFNYDIDYPFFPAIRRTGSNTNSGNDYYLRLGITHPITDRFHFTLETTQMKFSDFFSNTEQNNNTDFSQDYIGVGIGMRF